jgi:hypothetical protein
MYLVSLNLHQNKIGDEGANAIGRTLERKTCLISLNLNDNKIGDKGALVDYYSFRKEYVFNLFGFKL